MTAKLKPCKSCNAMIANSASKCPQCGAAKSNAARIVLIAVGGMVLAVLAWAMWIKPTMDQSSDLERIEQELKNR